MDPDENLKEQRSIARMILTHSMNSKPHIGMLLEEADRLAELVLAMDDWLANGGFLPAKWRTDV